MLYHDFLTNDTRLINKWVHYFPIYERHFSKFVNQSSVFIEIGVYKGGSLQMWKQYLGPFAKIIGIDIDPECKNYEEDQIQIHIGNQSDPVFLQSVLDDLANQELGPPDVVLDDGSHVMSDIGASFDFLYDKLSKNGVYLVEDLHTSYMPFYEGGLNRPGTFIERCKELLDHLNARHAGLDPAFANSTFSMSFYDSVAVFEKIRWSSGSLKSIMIPPPHLA